MLIKWNPSTLSVRITVLNIDIVDYIATLLHLSICINSIYQQITT